MLSLRDEIINTIHYSFIKASEYYQQTLRNKTVVKYFITAYTILIKIFKNENSPENELLLEEMNRRKLVTWCLISLVFNLDLAALLITAAHEYLAGGVQKGLLFYDTIHTMWRVRISDSIKEILRLSYASLIKREGMLNRFYKLDSGEELMEYQEAFIDEEVNSLLGLIPEYVLLFDNGISLSGKTSLGGLIAMKKILYNISNVTSMARVIYVLQHEISHKKWMLYGSGCLYSNTSPEEFDREGSNKESGYYTDNGIYGLDLTRTAPNLFAITEEMAYKIIERSSLTEEELRMLHSSHRTSEEIELKVKSGRSLASGDFNILHSSYQSNEKRYLGTEDDPGLLICGGRLRTRNSFNK